MNAEKVKLIILLETRLKSAKAFETDALENGSVKQKWHSKGRIEEIEAAITMVKGIFSYEA